MISKVPFFVLTQIVFAIGFIISCSSTAQLQKGTDLTLEKAFLQEFIPGEEHLKVKDYLHVNFESYNMEECKIDSVYYLNKIFQINDSKLNYKILLDSGMPTTDSMFVSSRVDVASVFYHKQKTSYYIKLEGIERMDSIYLP